MDRWVNDIWLDKWIDAWVSGWTGIWMAEWIGPWMDEWMDTWADRWQISIREGICFILQSVFCHKSSKYFTYLLWITEFQAYNQKSIFPNYRLFWERWKLGIICSIPLILQGRTLRPQRGKDLFKLTSLQGAKLVSFYQVGTPCLSVTFWCIPLSP